LTKTFIPPPPELEEPVVKRKTDISKEKLSDSDSHWLTQRKIELHRLRVKKKHKNLLNSLFPFFKHSSSKDIHVKHDSTTKNLLKERNQKIKELNAEVIKWKNSENLKKEEQIKIVEKESEIKKLKKDQRKKEMILRIRDKEIEKQRLIHEKDLQLRRKQELVLLRKSDVDRNRKIKQLTSHLHIKKQDRTTKKEIKKLMNYMKHSITNIQGMLHILNVPSMSDTKISKWKDRFHSAEDFTRVFADVKNKVQLINKKGRLKKSHLTDDISHLNDYFNTYSNVTKSARKNILHSLNNLKKKNKDARDIHKENVKQKYHAQLVKYRKQELHQLEIKKHRKLQIEIKKEKLKKKFFIKPKKHVEHIEIEEAIFSIKKDKSLRSPPTDQPSKIHVMQDAPNYKSEVQMPNIEFDIHQKDWIIDFLKNPRLVHKVRKLKQKFSKNKKETISIDSKDHFTMPTIEFETHYHDWVKDFLKKSIPKSSKKSSQSLKGRRKDSKKTTEQYEIEIEKDWLKDFKSEHPKVKRGIKKAKRIDWELDLEQEDWLKDFLKKRIPPMHAKSKKVHDPYEYSASTSFHADEHKHIEVPSSHVSEFEEDFVKAQLKSHPRKLKHSDSALAKSYEKFDNKLDYAIHMIFEARSALMKFDLRMAKDIYIDIINVYDRMSATEKIEVYEKIRELYDERKSAERLLGM